MDVGTLLTGGSDDIYMKLIEENLADRRIVLNQDIDSSVIEDACLYILKWNKEDKLIPIEDRKPIIIYINSNGGDAISGGNLVDIILASKTPVYGVCLGLAASMAYYIFISCHKRYAFKSSILLQHDGQLVISNSNSKAKDTMRFFDKMEDRFKQLVLDRTSMTEDFYDQNYGTEFYMYANDEGREYSCVDKIIGTDCSLDEIL